MRLRTELSSGIDTNVIATGSVTARPIEDRFADILNVKDYGAVGDGAADDTAAIQSAINAVGGQGGVVFIPPGDYRITSEITVAQGMMIVGPGTGHAATGAGAPTLRVSDATTNIFNVTTAQGVVFRDLAFGSVVTRTAGFDILISSDAVQTNFRSHFENLYFQGSWDAIGLSIARYWIIRDCFFDQIKNFSIFHPNTGFNDQGDNVLIGCTFVGAPTCQAHLLTDESTAIYVLGNKFFAANYGIWHLANGSTGTYQIVGNSFEDQKNAHIFFQQGSAGVIFGQININANEFSVLAEAPANPTVFLGAGTGQWLHRINISDNVFNHFYDANLDAISVQDGNGVMIANNVIDLSAKPLPGGIAVGGNATNVQVLDNLFINMTTAQRYKNGLTAGTIVRDNDGVAFADLGAWGNGSQLYVADGTFGSNPLTGSGTGAFARRVNGVWVGT